MTIHARLANQNKPLRPVPDLALINRSTKSLTQRIQKQLSDKETYQLMQVWLIFHCLLPSQEFQKNNAKAINIRFFIKPGCSCILWVNVPNRSKNISRCMWFCSWDAFSNPEIREMSHKILIHQDIWGFNIPVYNSGVAIMMKISQSLSSPNSYSQSCLPIKFYLLWWSCHIQLKTIRGSQI